MKIFINQDSRKFVASEKFNAAVPRFDFKRGDTSKIELGYVQNNQLVQLVGNFTIVFGIKEDGKFDGDFLVYEAVFVYNSATGFYEGEPNFNTIELNLLLGADDGDPDNDIPFVDCLFEISATDDNGIASSNTSVARVYHDVNKGNEGVPTGANPSYSVVGHTHPAYEASITSLEDRDWVELPINSIVNSDPPTAYTSNIVTLMNATLGGGYPVNGTLITDQRSTTLSIPQELHEYVTGVILQRNQSGASTWTPWKKVIRSENGTITDDLELAGTTYTAPNLITTDPDSLVTRKDLGANTVLVQTSADLSGTLDSSKTYKLDGIIDMGSQSITVPTGGLSIIGDTFDVSGLVSSEDAYTMFISESIAIGSGNLLMKDLKITTDGAGSKVYELYDATGFNAVELLRVNYIDCTNLGDLYDYRQGLESGTGRFGGSPSLTLHGLWRGGYRITTSIVRSLAGAMTEPLFKEGTAFQMDSRFLTDINCDLPTLAPFCDFTQGAFPKPSTIQLNGGIFSRDGAFDANDSNILTNLSPSDLQCDWVNNVGVGNTFVGGRINCDTEAVSSIVTAGTAVDLNGTFGASDLQHFDAPSNGVLRHIGINPKDFRVNFDFVIEGGDSDEVEVFLMKIDTLAHVTVEYKQLRVINNLQGGRDVAYFTGQTTTNLNQGDVLLWQVANVTDTTDVTLEVDSSWSINER